MKFLYSFAFTTCLFTATPLIFAVEDSNQPREITLKADKSNLKFDKTELTVTAGEKVKLLFVNPDGALHPHNVLIVKPGTAVRVGMLANRKMSDPEFMKNPNPKTQDVLFASKLLQAGEQEVIDFKAPSEPGDYPYVCTYPGHWAVMKGILKVVAKND